MAIVKNTWSITYKTAATSAVLGTTSSAAATTRSVKRVRENRDAGAVDAIDVLVEEERLRDAEIAEIRVKSQLILSWTRLHKALGGGWK